LTVFWISTAFLLLAAAAAASIVYTTIKRGISPMPSSSKVKEAMKSALPQHVQGKIYELGCGWGALAFHLAGQHPESQIVAFEVSPVPWLIAYITQRVYRFENVKLFWDDFFRTSFSDASVIFCYLYPGAMERLKKKFEEELAPGTLVVSNTFAVPGWEPVDVIKVNDLYRTKVYVYKR
jgi:precorrin-6B methylase 2